MVLPFEVKGDSSGEQGFKKKIVVIFYKLHISMLNVSYKQQDPWYMVIYPFNMALSWLPKSS